MPFCALSPRLTSCFVLGWLPLLGGGQNAATWAASGAGGRADRRRVTGAPRNSEWRLWVK